MLIEKLSSEELAMMDTWRRWHAWSQESSSRNDSYVPMAHNGSFEKVNT